MPKYFLTQSYLNNIASELDAFLMRTDYRYSKRNGIIKKSERISHTLFGLSKPGYVELIRSEIKHNYDHKVYDGLTYTVSGMKIAVKDDAKFLIDALSKILNGL